MEKSPSTVTRKLSPADTMREEIARLGREIIDGEQKLQAIHDESGDNSPEDNAQEAQADEISRQLSWRETQAKRQRMIELQEALEKLEKAA